MKCHYEILGINKSATQEEIKRAYRKLALECHPDKNLHCPEEAKERFQLVQQAYEILSDEQERAWYDRHREEILHAGDSEASYKDDFLDVFKYFTTSCFKGYSDDEKGFYTVYREVFQKIAAEDDPFREESDEEVPDFGRSDSPYEDVHNFYAYWQSYCTVKSFAWIEQYSISEHRKAGAGRQILRLVDKENKKLRDKHRKQRNEEVRQLVLFVKKRDKRVQAHKKLLEEQAAEKAKRFQEQQTKQMEERKRNLENYQESEWSSMSKYEDHFNEIEAHVDNAFGATNDEDSEELYCVACDKDFRSLKSFQNHLNSKKHKENVQILKNVMQEEELEFVTCENPELSDNDSELISNSEPSSKKKKKKKKKNANKSEANLVDLVSPLNDTLASKKIIDETTTKTESIKQRKKKKQSLPTASLETESSCSDCDIQSNLNDLKITGETSDDMNKLKVTGTVSDVDSTNDTKTDRSENATEQTKKKSGKLKTKKSSKASSTINSKNCQTENEKPSTICEKCGNNFHSRNKLFDHLKETGHAIYLGDHQSSKTTKSIGKVKNTKSNR